MLLADVLNVNDRERVSKENNRTDTTFRLSHASIVSESTSDPTANSFSTGGFCSYDAAATLKSLCF